jgi:two-component system KDP operon response regulator KdpE
MFMQQPFILLVEDDNDLRAMIARGLQATGYLVFQAANFRQAIDEMAVKPNLMILDINLPDATGWDVADWLESMTSAVPIIVISGLKPDEKRLQQFKPRAFLPKPFAIDDLFDLVQKYAPVKTG